MNKYIKKFILQGLVGMGFGPIILAIIYCCLHLTGIAETLPVPSVVKGILSITVMAFIAAGCPVIYQIDRLPLPSAILIHAGALYIDYLIVYLLNDWIIKDFTAIGVFTAIFFAGYALVWAVIYIIIRNKANHVNQRLHVK